MKDDGTLEQSDYEYLGPVPGLPGFGQFIYRPPNYPGPIAIDWKTTKESDDKEEDL